MQGVHTELAAHAPPPTMMQLVAVETLKLWETEGQAMVLSLDASTSEINRLLKDRGDILTVSYLNALEYVTADLYYKHRDIYNKIIAKRSEEGHVFTAVLAHADRPGVQAINKALIAKIGNWVLPLPRIAGTSQIAFDYTYGPITERVAIETFCTAALEDIVRDLPALDWEDTGDDAMEKEALEDESESAGDNADSDESADDEILPLSENAEMDNMAT
ncbi:hypothetical protein SARC_09203 [Sphaeroforma arctica JP610]|uniref:Uncharacterized protein n=1 Tax=Sphaeroforma arctica JP610 TaxID=667725 RepID=A0A0L0FPB9_9EUKA|nr:hypothetical protein SARC_09203 [Sphaeroforma arctica JP610]KNC78361.1 hypothetical protein SARC_09203 [Sphaeroforma arctica JP610]|eukprot:XP_014152263.1 hypothetical protein SARC_09203 [Sphaeroforma arctica JP610]